MFDFLFGWRKASTCKKLIKRVQCRIKLLNNKRHSIARQLREDVAQLIKIGYEDIAFNRVEQLFKDENIMAVYELLENLCELILVNLSYIRRNKDCPNDVNEAISSLIFASARCGDLPELRLIRKLFRERYGQRFEMTALELLPGNLVNLQVKERLTNQSVPDDLKQRLVDEIARDYCLRPEVLALEYATEIQQQNAICEHQRGLDTGLQTEVCRTEQWKETSNASDDEEKAIYVDSVSTRRSSTAPSHSQLNDNVVSSSVSPSMDQQSSPESLESPMHDKAGSKQSQPIIGAYSVVPEIKGERKYTASSSESLPQFPDETIVYLDDIEELKSPNTREGSLQDKRVFKFKSSFQTKNQKQIEDTSDVKYMDQSESWSEMSSRSSSRKKVKSARKRSKRRSMSLENLAVDINCVVYYNKTSKRSPNLRQRTYTEKKEIQSQYSRRFNPEVGFCSIGYRADCKVHSHHSRSSATGGSDTVLEFYTFSQQQRRRNPNCHLDKKSKVGNARPEEFYGVGRKENKPPYMRAMTMPQERSKDNNTENVVRSRSFPIQCPSHVHPNLPDYDDIAAKFMALKKEHQQNKCH